MASKLLNSMYRRAVEDDKKKKRKEAQVRNTALQRQINSKAEKADKIATRNKQWGSHAKEIKADSRKGDSKRSEWQKKNNESATKQKLAKDKAFYGLSTSKSKAGSATRFAIGASASMFTPFHGENSKVKAGGIDTDIAESKAYKRGKTAAEVASYLADGGLGSGLGKGIVKGGTKMLAKNALKQEAKQAGIEATEKTLKKAVEKKVAREAVKKSTKRKVAEEIAGEVINDQTVMRALDIQHRDKKNYTLKDDAKNQLVNAAFLGGAHGLAKAGKAVKSARKLKGASLETNAKINDKAIKRVKAKDSGGLLEDNISKYTDKEFKAKQRKLLDGSDTMNTAKNRTRIIAKQNEKREGAKKIGGLLEDNAENFKGSSKTVKQRRLKNGGNTRTFLTDDMKNMSSDIKNSLTEDVRRSQKPLNTLTKADRVKLKGKNARSIDKSYEMLRKRTDTYLPKNATREEKQEILSQASNIETTRTLGRKRIQSGEVERISKAMETLDKRRITKPPTLKMESSVRAKLGNAKNLREDFPKTKAVDRYAPLREKHPQLPEIKDEKTAKRAMARLENATINTVAKKGMKRAEAKSLAESVRKDAREVPSENLQFTVNNPTAKLKKQSSSTFTPTPSASRLEQAKKLSDDTVSAMNAMKDTKFVSELHKKNFNIDKYAKRNKISRAEALNKKYAKFKEDNVTATKVSEVARKNGNAEAAKIETERDMADYVTGKKYVAEFDENGKLVRDSNGVATKEFWRRREKGSKATYNAEGGMVRDENGKRTGLYMQMLGDDGTVAKVSAMSSKEKKTIKQKFEDGWNGFARKWFDDMHDFYALGKNTKDDLLYTELESLKDAHGRARMMVNGRGQYIHGTGGKPVKWGDKSLREIFEPVMKHGEDYYVQFEDYMFHKANIERYKSGQPVFGAGVSHTESEQVAKKLEEAHPEFKTTAGELDHYNKGLIEERKNTGLITEEQADFLNNHYENYVPTHRINEKVGSQPVTMNGIKVKDQIEKAKGSTRDLKPLHEQYIEMTNNVVSNGAMNKFGIRLGKDLEKLQPTNIRKITKEEYNPLEVVKQEVLPNGKRAYTFSVIQDGERFAFEIEKSMFDALANMGKGPEDLKLWAKVGRTYKGLLTTHNPLFALTNIPRDALGAPTFSQHPLTYYKNYAKAWMAQNPKSKYHDMYKMYLAMNGGGDTVWDIERTLSTGKWVNKGRNAAEKVVNAIDKVNEAGEQAGRFAEFLNILEHEKKVNGELSAMSYKKAFQGAKDVTVNFGRGGSTSKKVTRVSGSFFNAGIQEMVGLKRAIEKGGLKAGLPRVGIALAVTGVAPSMFNEMVNGDNPNYQALRQTEKDSYIILPDLNDDGKFVKVPAGRLQSVVGSFFRRAYADYNGADDAWENYATSVGNLMPVNPLEENILSGVVGTKRNETWYGTPIVPSSVQNTKHPEEEWDENTSEIAKGLSKGVHKGTQWLPGGGINLSPMKTDYLLKQYTGGAGQILLPMTTQSKGYGIGGVAQRKFITDSVTNSRYNSAIYDKIQEYNKPVNANETAMKNYFYQANKELSPLSDKIKEINSDKSLSAKERQEKVRELRAKQNKISKKYLENEDKAKKAAKEVNKLLDEKDFGDEKYLGYAQQNLLNRKLYGDKKAIQMEEAARGRTGKDGKKHPKNILGKLKANGISYDTYFKMKQYNLDVSQYNKMKESGMSIKDYARLQRQLDEHESYAGKALKLAELGKARNFKKAKAYNIKETMWNAAMLAHNKYGYDSDDIDFVGNYNDTSDEIKRYGVDKRGWRTQEGLKKYLDKRSDLNRKQKAIMWEAYRYKNWKGNNPYR